VNLIGIIERKIFVFCIMCNLSEIWCQLGFCGFWQLKKFFN